MNKIAVAVTLGAVLVSLPSVSEERETFGKWRIGVGGALNGGVTTRLGVRNLPVPAPAVVRSPTARTRTEAQSRAEAGLYDGGGFILKDSEDNGYNTTCWKLPVANYLGRNEDGSLNVGHEGEFLLHNAYQDVSYGSVSHTGGTSSQDDMQFGVSVEASRELWIHDEQDEHRWGVDFAAAFSYFFQQNAYRTGGTVRRTDTRTDGDFQTPVNDSDATLFYDWDLMGPVDGMYGEGVYNAAGVSPAPIAMKWGAVGRTDEINSSSRFLAERNYYASGDYRELEMLFMLRPWYEITDWWRVFGQVGLGVSWGKFSGEFHSEGLHVSEDFDQWDAYGVAGLGTAFRYGQVDLSVDFYGRFLRNDLDVNGMFVNGEIERSDWGFRVMAGIEF